MREEGDEEAEEDHGRVEQRLLVGDGVIRFKLADVQIDVPGDHLSIKESKNKLGSALCCCGVSCMISGSPPFFLSLGLTKRQKRTTEV